MLLISMLLAAAPIMTETAKASDNPFIHGAQSKTTAPKRATARRTATRSSPTAGGSPYYANCASARAAGAAPVMRGKPGYSRKLDRDNDGVGCE